MAKNHDFEELPLHCPFCGGCDAIAMNEELDEWTSRNWIMCMDCSAGGPVEETKEEAVLAWCERYDTTQARTIYTRTARRKVEFFG